MERLPNWRVPERFHSAGRDFVLYAEPLFAEAVADQLELALIEPPADWLPTIAERYLRREARFSVLSAARRLEEPMFVKPAEGNVFEPQVYRSGESLPTLDQVGDVTVLTSTPVSWVFEGRCFVLDRQMMTISPYWRNGALAQASNGSWPFVGDEEFEMREFLSTILADPEVALPPACVLDVGVIDGAGWAIIEANPCWGAGLYGCSPAAVLETIRRAVRPRGRVSLEDLPWIGVRNRRPKEGSSMQATQPSD